MIKRGEGACLVCGKPIVYYESAREMECVFCHRRFKSRAACEDGHYVCDECHEKQGIEVIMEVCRTTGKRDPVAIMQEIMQSPYIYMHGPEHHIMVGAALIAAYHNSGGNVELEPALEKMRERGGECPGGTCGMWGCCGAAVSCGMFISIILGATPLSGKEWGMANRMTSRALAAIGALGGPRCCKRDSFTAAKEAVGFVKEELGVEMELGAPIKCDFSPENPQCIRRACPYYKG